MKTIDITFITIETSRLRLRMWRPEDLNDFYEYASVPGVGELAGWLPHESIDVSHRILDGFIADRNVFALEHKENSKVIGSLGLHPSWTASDPDYSNLHAVEIGYVLSKEYWGRGLMPEAVQAVIDYLFRNETLYAITVSHYVHNRQSRRVIEKCGFTYIKETTRFVRQLEQERPTRHYILRKPE